MRYFELRAESGSGVSPLNEQSRDGSATIAFPKTLSKTEEKQKDERVSGWIKYTV
jgi:hypothetical protein